MIWINDSNIVVINTIAYDEIPKGTTFIDNGISSGYPLPDPPLPDNSTNTGVICDAGGSTSTTTTYCYYEGPTIDYPRGRIVWEGTLGPDLGATSPANAENEIRISFNVRVRDGVEQVKNTATIDADLNGDGDVEDPGEQIVATARKEWLAAGELPQTGFAPGMLAVLPEQSPEKAYQKNGNLILEIPSLGVTTDIVTVPLVRRRLGCYLVG